MTWFWCYRNVPTKIYGGPVCGNGFVEIEEECDCGLPEVCDDPKCDSANCVFINSDIN